MHSATWISRIGLASPSKISKGAWTDLTFVFHQMTKRVSSATLPNVTDQNCTRLWWHSNNSWSFKKRRRPGILTHLSSKYSKSKSQPISSTLKKNSDETRKQEKLINWAKLQVTHIGDWRKPKSWQGNKEIQILCQNISEKIWIQYNSVLALCPLITWKW